MHTTFIVDLFGNQTELIVGVMRYVATTVGSLTAVVIRVPLETIIVDAFIAPGAQTTGLSILTIPFIVITETRGQGALTEQVIGIGIAFAAAGSIAVGDEIAFITVVILGHHTALLRSRILQGNAGNPAMSITIELQGFSPVTCHTKQSIVRVVMQIKYKALLCLTGSLTRLIGGMLDLGETECAGLAPTGKDFVWLPLFAEHIGIVGNCVQIHLLIEQFAALVWPGALEGQDTPFRITQLHRVMAFIQALTTFIGPTMTQVAIAAVAGAVTPRPGER